MCGCSGSCSCSSTSLPIGPTGAVGADGAQGLYGGFSSDWVFNTSTSTGPSSTQLRFNNTTYSLVTAIYVSDTNANSIDYDAFLDSLSNNSNYGYIRIFKQTDNTKFWMGQITAIVDNGTDHTITVTYITSNSIFSANDSVTLTFSPAGNKISGVLSNNTTDVATSGAGVDALMSYVIPINTLKTNEDILELDMSYTMSAALQNKALSFTLNGATFITKLPAAPIANTLNIPKDIKYVKVKITITRKSTLAVFITIDAFHSSTNYTFATGFHFDEGTGGGTVVADLSANTLTIACFGENYDSSSNTETITQNQLLVKYFNK